MAAAPPKKKVKPTSRQSHVASSKQRLFAPAAAAREPVPSMTRAPTLRVVTQDRATPFDLARRTTELEATVARLSASLERAHALIREIGGEAVESATAEQTEIAADESGSEGDEAPTEPSVDPQSEELGGESA